MNFSKKIKSVEPSATLAITSKAKSLLAAGEDVIILAAGEPDFDTPDSIKEAAIKAIKDGKTKYTPASGTLSLKEAICKKLKNENGLEYSPSEIIVSNGAKHSLYNVMQVLLEPGDEVLVITPFWLSYSEMVKLADGVPRFIETKRENDFKVLPEEILGAVTPKTKAIIINSPSNPAGVVYSKKELEGIAKVCLEKGLVIISDEIYEKIIFDGREHASIASVSEEARNATVLVNGVSKSFSMTGWRVGYIAANKEIVSMMSTLQSHATSNPSSISQAAAEYALSADMKKGLDEARDKFQTRRDALLELLKDEEKIKPIVPGGAFYLFCDISACGLDSMTFAKRLLEEKKVAVIPGAPFGDDKSVRLSFATSMEIIEEGIKRMKDWIKTL